MERGKQGTISYDRRLAAVILLFKCPRQFTLGKETKPEISCEWNTKFSIIPEIP